MCVRHLYTRQWTAGLHKREEDSSAVMLLTCIRKPLISIPCLVTEYPQVFMVFLNTYGSVRHIAWNWLTYDALTCPLNSLFIFGCYCWVNASVVEYTTAINIDMRRLTTGIRSEKCVFRRFRRCANVYLHKPR